MVIGAVLLVAGPALLPKLGRTVGKTLTGLRESAESFSDNLREEMKADRDEPQQLTPGAEAEPSAAETKASRESHA